MDKRIYMKKIVLDVDGVLLNFMKSFDETAKSFLPRKVEFFKDEYKQDYYHLSKRIGGSEKEADEILEYMQDASVYERLLPLDGAKEAVKKIKEATLDQFEAIVGLNRAKLIMDSFIKKEGQDKDPAPF